MKLVRIERTQYSEKFIPILESNHRYIVAFGGRGSGKTNHIILKLLALTFLEEHINIVYCRHEKTTLRDTTFRDIINYIKNSKYKDYFEYSEAYNSSMIFTNKITGKKLLPFGLSDEENTKGISEATHIWIDEVDKCTETQVTMINSVLRTPKAKTLQLIVSFNPVSEKHWIRSFFFSEFDAYKPNERFGNDLLIHHSTLQDNEYIDRDEYQKTLQLNYGNRQNLLNVNVLGLWGLEENKSPYFYAFDNDKHVSKTPLQWFKQAPIYLSFDFNIDPATCVVSQFIEGGFINIIKSYKVNNCTLKELLTRIKSDFHGAVFKVTSDPAGGARNAGYDSINTTMHKIIRTELNLGINQMYKPLLNYTRSDAHTELRIFVNNILQNHPKIQFCSVNCKELIHDIEIATTLNGTDKMRKTSGNTEFGMHLADGFIYLLATFFNNFAKRKL